MMALLRCLSVHILVVTLFNLSTITHHWSGPCQSKALKTLELSGLPELHNLSTCMARCLEARDRG